MEGLATYFREYARAFMKDWVRENPRVDATLTYFIKDFNGRSFHTESETLLVEEQINFVNDRPGHDFRYAIDASKIKNELSWKADENFESGIKKTINWYINKYKE